MDGDNSRQGGQVAKQRLAHLAEKAVDEDPRGASLSWKFQVPSSMRRNTHM